MSTTAESVLEQIRRLPPAELREVCQAVLELAAHAAPASLPTGAAGTAASEIMDDANESAFLAGLAEARRLWAASGRDVPNLD